MLFLSKIIYQNYNVFLKKVLETPPYPPPPIMPNYIIPNGLTLHINNLKTEHFKFA